MSASRSVHRPRFSPSLASRLALAGCGLALFAPGALAQKSDAEVRAEIDFARGLASRWSFVDLATEVVKDVEAEGVSAAMSEQLGLVKCDVYAMGAQRERDPARQRELFEEALAAYTEFIDRNSYSDALPDAEAAYVKTAANYSRAIDVSLDDAVGDEAEALRERKVAMLLETVDQTAELIQALEQIPAEERTERQTRQLFDLMLNRGDMLADLGASQDDGTFFFDQAISTLENLVFAAGEGTPYALRAFNAIGKVYSGMGANIDASAYYEAVIEQTLPTDLELWNELIDLGMTDGEKGLRFLFAEQATGGLMDALLESGDLDTAVRFALHFYNTQRREGFSFSGYGYQSLLGVARVLLEAGGYIGGDATVGEAQWFATEEEMKDKVSGRRNQSTSVDLALRIAQQVNEANPTNFLSVRAQKVIGEIVSRPGVEVSPDILLEAAEGDYHDGSYLAALKGFHRVLRALDGQDQVTRLEYGAKVMNNVANCYRKMERPLEAAMAFREGVTTWVGDPEYDSKNAQGYNSMIANVASRATADTDPLQTLVSESESLVLAHGSAKKDEVTFNMGVKAARDKDWDRAIETYQLVEDGSDYWEKAQVEMAYGKLRKGDLNGALADLETYLEQTVNDPKRASTSPIFLARRKEAMAKAEFFRGYIVSKQAAKDPGLHKRVVELLDDYHVTYPEQDSLAASAMQLVIVSQLAEGQLDDARTMLDALDAEYGDSKPAGAAAVSFYKALSRAHDEADEAARRPLLEEMARRLSRSNKLATSPDFGNLRNESLHWMDLGNYANAEKVLTRILTKYGDDPSLEKQIRSYIKPDLGRALLEQQKVAEAKEVLAPLALDETNRASRATILNWVRSVTGWLEGGKDIGIVPGAGETAEEFEQATSKMNAIAGGGQSWISCDWYEHKFMFLYGYYQWGQIDSKKLEYLASSLGVIVSETGSDFGAVDRFCDGDETEADLRERLGGGVLQARYRWLRSQL